MKELLKENWRIKKQYKNDGEILVVVVKLPNGKKELITNYGKEQIDEKINYYINAYDDELKLKSNNDIQIVDWLIV